MGFKHTTIGTMQMALSLLTLTGIKIDIHIKEEEVG